MRHGHDLDDWLDAEKIAMENRDSHAKEIKQEVNVVKKPIAGFRRTLKEEGFYKKVEIRQLESRQQQTAARSGTDRNTNSK